MTLKESQVGCEFRFTQNWLQIDLKQISNEIYDYFIMVNKNYFYFDQGFRYELICLLIRLVRIPRNNFDH